MTNADFQQDTESESPETIAEQLFAAAKGDHSKALDSWWKLNRPHEVYVALEAKFTAAAAIAAKQVRAEAGDDRVLAHQLASSNFHGLRTRLLEDAVRAIYRAEDGVAADGIVEACHTEAGGDHRLGYQLAIEAAAGNEYIRNRVTTELRNRFVADTTKRLVEAGQHPFGGKCVTFRGGFGIEADGKIFKGRCDTTSDTELLQIFYRYAAVKIETKIEAGVRAGKTRTRRHEKRLNEITEGLRSGKVYGPATHCVCCKKHLTDEVSIQRGIGPECFEHIQKHLEREAF